MVMPDWGQWQCQAWDSWRYRVWDGDNAKLGTVMVMPGTGQ